MATTVSWVPNKAAVSSEHWPEEKVPIRSNPLVGDKEDLAVVSEARKSVGHPSRLNRAAVKAEVLKTFTTNQPISSFIDIEEGISQDQKAKMLAERLGTTIEIGGGGVVGGAPGENGIGGIGANRVIGNTQVELVAHVEGLDKELRNFWKNGEKVRSTRVTIQAIKMLCAPKVPQCYPSIFMLVSSVMDTFGDFVAKRLQELSAGQNVIVATLLKKGQDADADLIPPETVEVCNNWFLKISSIRELVPRICVELSLLKCFRYVSKKMRSAMPEVVERLAGQIRGIADPLVASHIRWYLFLRAAEVLHGREWATPLTECYFDQLHMLQSCKHAGTLPLYAPSLQWMLDTLLAYGNTDDRPRIISKTVELVFELKCAPLSAVLFRALTIRDLTEIGIDTLLSHVSSFKDPQERAVAISGFCLSLVDGEIPGTSRAAKTALLSEIHGVADLDTMPVQQFLIAVEALLLLCAAHFGPKQIHVILRITREKLINETSNIVEGPLSNMISRLIRHFSPGPLLTSPDLVPLVRMVSSQLRGDVIVNLLRAVPTGNEAYMAVALELCRILEQSQVVGKSTDADEFTRLVSKTLISVCPNDPEAKLAFLCEARHTLSDAEILRATLIHIALRTVDSLSLTTRKRRNIAKVFFAFAHVTIPALQSPFTRLRTALIATAIAFKKGLVSNGEGLMHLCVTILPDLQPLTTSTDGTVSSNDSATKDAILQLVSIAAAVPPHAKYGHLYLFESVLQWSDKYQWPTSSTTKYSIWLSIVRIATRLMKDELRNLSYPLCGTSHNLSDPTFTAAANEAAVGALKRTLFNVHRLHSDSPQHPLLHDICLEGFETMMVFGQPSKSLLARCAGSLFWKVGKESCSGVISPAMERARAYAVKNSSEKEVNEVVYYEYQKELVFEKFGCRLTSEDASGVVGAAVAEADTVPASPPAPSQQHIDPNMQPAVTTSAGPAEDALDDVLAAAENGGGEIDELDALAAAEAEAAADNEDL